MFTGVSVLLALVVVVTCAPRVKHPHPHPDGRIVGGKDANIEDYPYQLSLAYMGSHVCGASIISDKWAITAAHCTVGVSAEALTVRAGSSSETSGGQVIKVKSTHVHPKFDYDDIDYDMSLIELETPIKASKISSSIQLVAAGTKEKPGSLATVTGWGTTKEDAGSLPSQLQVVTVPIISNAKCNEYYEQKNITDRMLCAGLVEGGKDSCQGDSGGPLVINKKLAGIVSWGYGCARPKYPGVYSNIASMRDFVTKIAGI